MVTHLTQKGEPMNNKILLATEAVTLAIQFVLCMFLFLTAQILILGTPAPWYEQCVFFVYLGVAIAIRLLITNSFLIFIGLHLFLVSSIFVLPFSLLMTIESGIYLTFLILQSVDFWKRNGYRQNTTVPWPSVCVMLGFYLFAILTKNTLLCNVIYILGSVYLLLYLARLYLTGLYHMANDKTATKQFPLDQVTRINSTMILLILAVTAITIALANIVNLDHIVISIGRGLLVIAKYIIAIFVYLWSLISRFFHGSSDPDVLPDSDLFRSLKQEPTLLAILFDILFKIFECVMFSLMIFWIFKSLYRLSKKFMLRNLLDQDHIEGLRPNQHPTDADLSARLDHVTGRMPRSKIRRQYKRAILKHKDEIALHAAMTTNEIYAALSDQSQKQISTLHQKYNEERYHTE